MAERIDLPSGGWVVLRDPRTVTNRERKPILDHMIENADAFKHMGEKQQATEGLSFAEKLVKLMVKEWSFALPLPAQAPESLLDIPSLDYDFLCVEVQKDEHSIFLNTKVSPDPKASDSGSGSSDKALPLGTWTEGNSQTISGSIS